MTVPSEVRGRSLGGTPGAARHSKGHRGVLLLPGGVSSSWRSHGFVASDRSDLRRLVTRDAMEMHGSFAKCACVGQRSFLCDLTDKAGGALVRGFTPHASLPLGSQN